MKFSGVFQDLRTAVGPELIDPVWQAETLEDGRRVSPALRKRNIRIMVKKITQLTGVTLSIDNSGIRKYTVENFWKWLRQYPRLSLQFLWTGVKVYGLSWWQTGPFWVFNLLCKKGEHWKVCRPPSSLLGGRTEMAGCRRGWTNFQPNDWQVWSSSVEGNLMLLENQAWLWKRKLI